MKFIRSALAFWLLYARRMSRTARTFFGGPALKPYLLLLAAMGVFAIMWAIPKPRGPQIIASGSAPGLAAAYTLPSQLKYNANATSSVTRTLANKIGDATSAKDFGAVGDGSTDDTTAIQACLNTVKSCYLPEGTYKITASLAMFTNSVLRGASHGLTIITAPTLTTGTHMFSFTGKSYVIISDLALLGPGGGQDVLGIQALGCIQCRFEKLRITFTSTGIGIYSNTVDTVVINNIITNQGQNGILVQGDRNRVEGNKIDTVGTSSLHHGIYAQDGDANQYVGNIISNVYGFCVHVYVATASVSISNVRVIGNYCKSGGLAGSGTRGGIVVRSGATTTTVRRIVVEGNTIDSTTTNSIMVSSGANDIDVVGNTISNFQGDGLLIQGETGYGATERVNISGNAIFSGTVSGNGIRVLPNSGTVQNLTIAGNTLDTIYGIGIWAQGLADSAITGNRVEDYNTSVGGGNNGIRVESTSVRNIIQGNRVSTSFGAEYAINIVAAADVDNVVIGNTVINNPAFINNAGTRTFVFANKVNATDSIVPTTNPFGLGTTTQANLGTPANGTVIYCSDCTTASACTAAGTGAFASRQNGAWKCL